MANAPMPISLAAYIKDTIDWDHDFDLDLEQIVAHFPNLTDADLEHALTTVAAKLREVGQLNTDQALLNHADAFDDMRHEWIERFRARA